MRGEIRSALTVLAAVAALCATAAFADPVFPPAVTRVTCKGLKTIEVVNSEDTSITNSQTYVSISGSLVHFVTKKPGCVLVTFSAPSQPFDNIISVQMLVSDFDCLPSGSNNVNLFAEPDSSSEAYANSMTYLCPNVTAGRHGIQAQWKTSFSTPSVSFYGFNMTVAHR